MQKNNKKMTSQCIEIPAKANQHTQCKPKQLQQNYQNVDTSL